MKLFTKLGIVGGVFFITAVVVFSIFPILLRSQVNKESALKRGTQIRSMWQELPFPLDFKIYLFNITNPADIERGAKPIVKEIGPFFYEEWKHKANVIDREEDDTVEFSFKLTWHFNQAKSAPGLTEDVELTLPHLFMMSVIMTTLRERPAMVGLASKSMDSVIHQPKSLFIKTTPREILWDGLPIDCTVEDFAGSAACLVLRGNDESLIKDGVNYKFALFGHKNGTISPNRIRVKRGLKDISQVGLVTEYNGEPKLDFWSEEGNCNTLNGTDTTIFRPYLYPDEDIMSFTSDLCRSMTAKFQKYSNVSGISSNRYTIDLGDMSKDPELKCFCPSNTTCLKKGLFDLYNCLKVPIIASLPHFYRVDDEYLQQVDGLHPNESEHELFLDFEPLTGTPLSARNRIQFNMFIHPVQKFPLMKKFPTALLPLFWIEEGLLIGDEYIEQINDVFTIISAVECIKWTMLMFGILLGGIAYAVFYKAQQAKKTVNITKVPSK